jgi:3-hydroxymyristoyl/3-hydroxydecanoyl-(acyl carrier protein) dehydratase
VLELLRRADAGARPDRAFQRACTVQASHPSLPGHFPGRPTVPGALLLARVEALLRTHGLRIVAMPAAKFSRAVQPDEPLMVRVDVIDGGHARFAIDAKGKAAASGTLRIEVAT